VIVLAHGDLVPVDELGSAWSLAWPVVVGAVLALALYAQAFVRLRRRGRADHASWDRLACFAAGTVLITLALLSPLDAIGEEYLLSAHMLQHVLIGDAGPALVVLGLRGPICFFLLPAAVLGPLARSPLRAVAAFLVRPKVSLGVWALTYAAWHVPQAYGYTLTHRVVHDLEHTTMILAGILVWTQLVDPARRAELSLSGRIGFAVTVFIAGQILAQVLIFTMDPLYGAYAAQDERLLGFSPMEDQRYAGLVMMVEQVLTLGVFAFWALLEKDREADAAAART
jgi:putative membrane protein